MERDVLKAIRGPVGQGGDEVGVAGFIADQRAKYRVPHTVTCLLLGVSMAWCYKWLGRATGPSATSGLHTPRDRLRDRIDRAVRTLDVYAGLFGDDLDAVAERLDDAAARAHADSLRTPPPRDDVLPFAAGAESGR